MNRFMTIVAGAAVAALPVGAFAQTAATPAPAVTGQVPAATAPAASGTVAKQAPTAKADAKAPVAAKKPEVHGAVKTQVPAKG